MKSIKNVLFFGSNLLLFLLLQSCTSDSSSKRAMDATVEEKLPPQAESSQPTAAPASLPIQYQTPSYLVDKTNGQGLTIAEEGKLKVGARITSTRGPQPLWDIVKRLAALKGMNVSWASDVDKNALVDVDINADDDFFEALDNMLRQIDYFHEMQDNTIVIKYKETRQFQIAMPFASQSYSTGTGGNVLGGGGAESEKNITKNSTNVEGTIKLDSKDNKFDVWENIKLNLDTILEKWTYRREGETIEKDTKAIKKGTSANAGRSYKQDTQIASEDNNTEKDTSPSQKSLSIQQSAGLGYYMIDKPVGLITVTAPRSVLDKVEAYITNLKKSLYLQISIEAKIIEVQLDDSSSIGINWSSVLKDFNLSGVVEFGANGQVYPFIYNNDAVNGPITYTDGSKGAYFKTINPGQFVSNITMNSASFDVFLNALKEQGDTKILSNPKLSVMNGQPSLITVGRNVTYIDNIESKLDSDTGVITYTVNTERILSGVGMALTATVFGKDEIIMNLVPITSELQEPITYKDVGNLGGTVGLPIINVREMSTTVKVKDGEMLVIGGLISSTDKNTGEFAPLLGDIPFIKYLFGWEEKQQFKRELIVLLRPRII